jgi:hypothetical protein
VHSQAKKRRVGGQQAATGGRRCAWWLRRAAVQRVCVRRSHQGRLSGGRASWGPDGAGRAAKGQLVAGENAGDGRWAALQRNREGEAGGRRRGPVRKVCKNPGCRAGGSSNENMPKIKSVELKKIYHFALGSNFKRVRVLKLF